MDTYTFATLIPSLVLIYIGEKFRTGVYTILASMFWILYAWRVAEPGFYIASAAVIIVLLYRGIYANGRSEITLENKDKTSNVA